MNKYCLISVRPEHAINILNGKKTLELRTWIPKNYVGWVYVYVTKSKPYLIRNKNYVLYTPKINLAPYSLNGKVAFRFWFDEYDVSSMELVSVDREALVIYPSDYKITNSKNDLPHFIPPDEYGLYEKSCVTFDEYIKYSKNFKNIIYLWHIKKLEIFDEPKQLSDFDLTKAPKNMVIVYE